MHADEPITEDDSITCKTEFSKVRTPLLLPLYSPSSSFSSLQVLPLEGGEIFVALTTGRPSMNNIQESEVGTKKKVKKLKRKNYKDNLR